MLRRTAQRVERQFPLIGCGGIASGADAYAKIRAGATLVQLYSAMVYEGPPLIRRIKDELAALLARDGFAHGGRRGRRGPEELMMRTAGVSPAS